MDLGDGEDRLDDGIHHFRAAGFRIIGNTFNNRFGHGSSYSSGQTPIIFNIPISHAQVENDIPASAGSKRPPTFFLGATAVFALLDPFRLTLKKSALTERASFSNSSFSCLLRFLGSWTWMTANRLPRAWDPSSGHSQTSQAKGCHLEFRAGWSAQLGAPG